MTQPDDAGLKLPLAFRQAWDRMVSALELRPGSQYHPQHLFELLMEGLPDGTDPEGREMLASLAVPFANQITELDIARIHGENQRDEPWITANMGMLEMLRRMAATSFVWAWLRGYGTIVT